MADIKKLANKVRSKLKSGYTFFLFSPARAATIIFYAASTFLHLFNLFKCALFWELVTSWFPKLLIGIQKLLHFWVWQYFYVINAQNCFIVYKDVRNFLITVNETTRSKMFNFYIFFLKQKVWNILRLQFLRFCSFSLTYITVNWKMKALDCQHGTREILTSIFNVLANWIS